MAGGPMPPAHRADVPEDGGNMADDEVLEVVRHTADELEIIVKRLSSYLNQLEE